MEAFGKYEVLELVGQGGFGKIYKGYDPVLKRPVAIKTCSFTDPTLRERFVREAEISARLRHPHIVTVYDFGEENGEPYLVQEYLPGEDLSDKIKRGEPRDLPTKVHYLLQVAQALGYAHAHGVIHRDIKPSNVRIEEGGHVRILDFGIAKLVEADRQLTQTGVGLGTLGYLSPEQLRGKEIDHRTDIFSFGVVAYELVAGRKPFDGDSISSVFYKIAHEEPPPLTETAPDCDPELASCIMQCLEKEPESRYPDFAAVVADLGAIQASLLRGARPPAPSVHAPVSAGRVEPLTGPTPEPVTSGAAGPPEGAGAGPGDEATGPTRRRFPLPAMAGLAVAAMAVAVFGILNVAGWVEPVTLGEGPRDRIDEGTGVETPDFPLDPIFDPTDVAAAGTEPVDEPEEPAAQPVDREPAGPAEPARPAEREPDRPRTTERAPEPPRTGTVQLAGAQPPGARVTLVGPGDDTRRIAGDPLGLLPGRYRVLGEAPGYEPIRAAIDVRAGEAVALRLDWREVAPEPAPREPAEPAVDEAAAAAEIRDQLLRFLAAFESREMDQVMRAYPGATEQWRRDWSTFVENTDHVRNLSARLDALRTPQISGTTARTAFVAVLDYRDYRNRRQQQRIEFQATFDWAEGVWHLTRLVRQQPRAYE